MREGNSLSAKRAHLAGGRLRTNPIVRSGKGGVSTIVGTPNSQTESHANVAFARITRVRTEAKRAPHGALCIGSWFMQTDNHIIYDMVVGLHEPRTNTKSAVRRSFGFSAHACDAGKSHIRMALRLGIRCPHNRGNTTLPAAYDGVRPKATTSQVCALCAQGVSLPHCVCL